MSTARTDKSSPGDSLPLPPAVASQILRLIGTDNLSVHDHVEAVQKDPTLTARILRYVNSSLPGIPREIGTIERAVAMLGLYTMHIIALGFSVLEILPTDDRGGFDSPAYWRRLLTTAVAGQLLAGAVCPMLAEQAFVAGLLSDLGAVGAGRSIPRGRTSALQAMAPEQTPAGAEQGDQGLTRAAKSHGILREWGFPEALCDAVGASRAEGLEALSGPTLDVGRIVHSAAAIAALFSGDVPISELDAIKAQCRTETGIEGTVLEDILLVLNERLRATASVFSVEVGETLDYAQLAAEAPMEISRPCHPPAGQRLCAAPASRHD